MELFYVSALNERAKECCWLEISGIAVNAGQASLTPGSPFGLSTNYGMAATHDFLFVGTSSNGAFLLTTYRIDHQTGAVRQVAQRSQTDPVSGTVVTSPDGRYLYTGSNPGGDTNGSAPEFHAYAIQPDGSLRETEGSPYTMKYPVFGPQSSPKISPDGKWFCGLASKNSNLTTMIDCRSIDTQTGAFGSGSNAEFTYDTANLLGDIAFLGDDYLAIVNGGTYGSGTVTIPIGIDVLKLTDSGIQYVGNASSETPQHITASSDGSELLSLDSLTLYRFDSGSESLTEVATASGQTGCHGMGGAISVDKKYVVAGCSGTSDNPNYVPALAGVWEITNNSFQYVSGSPLQIEYRGTEWQFLSIP